MVVDGVRYESAPGDLFTVASVSNGNLNVQCVAVVADVRFTFQIAAGGVTGTGMSQAGVGQWSEQPATGGSPTQYRTFAAKANVVALSPTSISGTSQFKATGIGSNKDVSAAFNLPSK